MLVCTCEDHRHKHARKCLFSFRGGTQLCTAVPACLYMRRPQAQTSTQTPLSISAHTTKYQYLYMLRQHINSFISTQHMYSSIHVRFNVQETTQDTHTQKASFLCSTRKQLYSRVSYLPFSQLSREHEQLSACVSGNAEGRATSGPDRVVATTLRGPFDILNEKGARAEQSRAEQQSKSAHTHSK